MFDNIIYCYRGSIAHNLYIPSDQPMSTDDVDTIGICIPPIDYYFGLSSFEVQEIKDGQDDIIIYEIRKFFRLLLKANPNALAVLWNDPTMYLTLTAAGNQIIENRELFSSQLFFNSINGYATSQLKDMFKDVYKGYMGDKRKQLVDKFGYDTKNASHLIRLLRMGIKFLKTGYLEVYREKDRNELIDIKQGKWTQEQIEKEAHKLFADLHEAKSKSKLPEQADFNKVQKLLVGIMEEHFSKELNNGRV